MNEHISLVKKWLNDPDSVSKKELRANFSAASDAVYAASRSSAHATDAAYQAAHAAHAAPYSASAAYWVKQYEELENDR